MGKDGSFLLLVAQLTEPRLNQTLVTNLLHTQNLLLPPYVIHLSGTTGTECMLKINRPVLHGLGTSTRHPGKGHK